MTDPRGPDDIQADDTAVPTGAETLAGLGAAPPTDPHEALVRESAELKDKLLRTLAEMENLRRRTDREVADARNYGIASFARDILAVADNMERALEALDAELREKADARIKALFEGVELTERQLLSALERHGVRKFDPAGQKFDPNLHQAMYEVPDSTVPAGIINQVIQPGYMIGERVLRPALVAVTKGGPKAAAPEAAAAGAGDSPANDNSAADSQDAPP